MSGEQIKLLQIPREIEPMSDDRAPMGEVSTPEVSSEMFEDPISRAFVEGYIWARERGASCSRATMIGTIKARLVAQIIKDTRHLIVTGITGA